MSKTKHPRKSPIDHMTHSTSTAWVSREVCHGTSTIPPDRAPTWLIVRQCQYIGFAKPKIEGGQVRTIREHSGDRSPVVRSHVMPLNRGRRLNLRSAPVAQAFAMLNSRSDRRTIHKRDPSQLIPGTIARGRLSSRAVTQKHRLPATVASRDNPE